MKVEKTEVRWGKIPVLIPSQRRLKVTNESLISAEFKVWLKSKIPCFSVSVEEGTLAPQVSETKQHMFIVLTKQGIYNYCTNSNVGRSIESRS